MVVMPHGGPQVRDQIDFDRIAQALAAQGWLVLQPNFRGSTGYGRAFIEAGHRHWGDAMQWDLEDCVDSLVKAGRADPRRLAIMGDTLLEDGFSEEEIQVMAVANSRRVAGEDAR